MNYIMINYTNNYGKANFIYLVCRCIHLLSGVIGVVTAYQVFKKSNHEDILLGLEHNRIVGDH